MKAKRTTEISDEVSARLIESIVTCKIAPGQPLREARLAKEWGVSRTPVREAVRSAAALGLVELRLNRAPMVRILTSIDVENLYALRETLEIMALNAAFGRIPSADVTALHRRNKALNRGAGKSDWRDRALALDTELHQLWIARCDNRWLQQAIEQLWTFIKILQQIVAQDDELLRDAIEEHRAILEALRADDKTAARNALLQHIRSSAEYLKRKLPST